MRLPRAVSGCRITGLLALNDLVEQARTMPAAPLADHKDASIVLYYGFSVLAQYSARSCTENRGYKPQRR